jgi:hypothetical protein
MLRDVSVHAIWEGSGNVIALDVLRALNRGAGPHFLGDLERRAEATGESGPSAPLSAPLLREVRQLAATLDALAGADAMAQQLPIRRLARRMAILAVGTRLAEQGNRYAAATGSGRLAWIAARFIARLRGEALVDRVAGDAGWLAHADAILNGGRVPVSVGESLSRAVAAGL